MLDWALKRMPSREALLAQRWARPFARVLGSPVIWRFNRRAVARGVGLGLFFGFVVPLMQTPVAAAFALPARANLPIAGLMTFVTNPFTTPFIYVAAYAVGVGMLGEPAETAARALAADVDGFAIALDWCARALDWLWTAGGRAWFGLLVFGAVAGATGFAATHVGWRLWVQRRWRRRAARRMA